MASDADPAAAEKRKRDLQVAANLPPLSLAVVEIADTILRELASEIAEDCVHESAQIVPCDPAVRNLLEGAADSLPGGGSTISKALHTLLSEEASRTARCAKRSREALAPSFAGTHHKRARACLQARAHRGGPRKSFCLDTDLPCRPASRAPLFAPPRRSSQPEPARTSLAIGHPRIRPTPWSAPIARCRLRPPASRRTWSAACSAAVGSGVQPRHRRPSPEPPPFFLGRSRPRGASCNALSSEALSCG